MGCKKRCSQVTIPHDLEEHESSLYPQYFIFHFNKTEQNENTSRIFLPLAWSLNELVHTHTMFKGTLAKKLFLYSYLEQLS